VNGLFTSESVTEGHPDKVADQISDAILDACLAQDPTARVACETLVAPGNVVLAGEITTSARIDREAIARDTIARVGYDDPALGFDAERVKVSDLVGQQSAQIAAGVDVALETRNGITDSKQILAGAGDQGMMFGYASDETPELLPLPIALAHRLARGLAAARRNGTVPGLRPDGKTQVSVRYQDGVPVTVERVVISAHHAPDVSDTDLRESVLVHVVDAGVPAELWVSDDPTERVLINPAGRFTLGGPAADSGLTGRKIIVDTYGGMVPHGGGAFSGKDPSKVDRSAAYAARHVAGNVVAAGLAPRCVVQIAYAIGVASPVSLFLETFGTGQIADDRLTTVVGDVFDLRPGAIRMALDLDRPIYRQTAAYGHFGRPDLDLPWERLDRVDDLRRAAGC
jgi:S-adenosylmethionine synthetase